MAIEDAIVLADLLGDQTDLETALRMFGDMRWERCRLVNENSLQLGEWEKHSADPGADPGRLIGESMAFLAQPFRRSATPLAGVTAPHAGLSDLVEQDP